MSPSNRREFINRLLVSTLAASSGISGGSLAATPGDDKQPAALVRLLADHFVSWQNSFGKPDPAKCPFVTPGKLGPTQLHSPTFLASALYNAFAATNEQRYRDAADRYVTYYFSTIRNPAPDGSGPNRLSRPWIFGMGLAAYHDFNKAHPDETALDGKAAAMLDWLRVFRWREGSYFRNGYGSPDGKIPDAANSDDNCHMGRGLMGYFAITKDESVLNDAEGLARYYLAEVEPGTYRGCWSSKLGTWVVGPTNIDKFEHFEGHRSHEIAWGFTSTGAIEYLTKLHPLTRNADLKAGIQKTCTASMKWQFDQCQFEDGACGMHTRDDKWLGMTAGAILSYLRVRDAGFLNRDEESTYGQKARIARDWLIQNTTDASIRSGGYFRITGKSQPRPRENLAWLLAWTLDALHAAAKLDRK